MTKEEIYECMTVQLVHPNPEIPCEFDESKPCAELYGKVCEARLRLSERTGLDYEDYDLEEIVRALEKIAKLCSLKMFDYGMRYATQNGFSPEIAFPPCNPTSNML